MPFLPPILSINIVRSLYMYKRDDYEYREYIYIYTSVPNMIGRYIYIGKRNITTTSKMLVYFFLSISVFSLSFFYRHRCSTLIDPPYPLHPATRFERFAARYVKRERVFFPLTSARSPLTSAYRAHTMFYVYARACVCIYIYTCACEWKERPIYFGVRLFLERAKNP